MTSIKVTNIPVQPLFLGFPGENDSRPVYVDVSPWLEEFPDATVSIVYTRSDGLTYAVVVNQIGPVVTWKPMEADLVTGECSLQIQIKQWDAVKKDRIVACIVGKSLDDPSDPPQEPRPTHVEEAIDAADRAEVAVTHYPKIVNGVWFVWDAETGEFVSTGISAQGEDGVSPTVTVTTIAGGHRVTITDASGDHVFDVMDGQGGSGGSTVYVTPEQFGAVGDGVTDDTAAVRQAMQNPAVALQKTYKVTEAITCSAQLVQGIDGGGIVSSAGGLVFANTARLMDFSASLPHGYDGNVIEAKGSAYADGLTVTGGKIGILASGQYKSVEIRNCAVSDQWGESSRGIYIPFAGETLIEGNTVDTVTNDTTVNADGISVWQSKEEQHPTVVIRGNTIHNCRGRFIKASTRDAVVGSNYCYNDSDFNVIPYFVAIDVQNGCSIVRGNTVIAPSGINVSLRDTAGLRSVHVIEYNKLVYNGVSASNKTMIATTDYANGNASSQVSIVGNDITARGDNSASITLAYVPSAKYNVYNNRVRGGTWYAMAMKGTFDATTRLEVLGNTNADYAYFARFVGGMPNVKGDRTVRCETALDFASVLRDTSFTANTTAIDGFTNTAFVQGHDGATGYWIEIWDGTEVGGYKTNGQQIFYHKQGEKHVSSVNGLSGDVTLTIPTAVSDLTNDSGYQTAQDVQTAISGKADKTPRVAMASTDATPTLDPNKLYVFPEMATLTPTLNAPSDNTIVNEYHFVFDSGSTATVLTLPASVLQPDGFTVEANMHYEISILEGAMTAQGWAVTSA